ncbi:MAG TPA: diaminopimelate epimerase [Planococcus sp. (in: firmicutes)]|nr:diaminopimelate epimerase [Planococcus sp. (in: firmicutes)]
MEMTMLKVHGSMNTFYMLEGAERDDYDRLAVCLFGLDPEVDGLLVILPSDKADAKMRVFNNDGSEASMCGNGLRCVARFVCERDQKNEALIETMKASLRVKKEDMTQDGLPAYSVEISPVLFDLSAVPMEYGNQKEWVLKPLPFISEEILFSAVAVPNPHLVGIVPASYQKDSAHQKRWAEHFNGDNEIFADGVNVSYATAVEDGIFVRTFERGVGFTNACGTAMTASALIACIAGIVPYGEVKVYNPGGMVKCLVRQNDDTFELQLSGNATYLSQHSFDWNTDQSSGHFTASRLFDEQAEYEKFIAMTVSRADRFIE